MTIVLELDLTSGLSDEIPSDPLERIMSRRRLALPQVITRLMEAADDPRVIALLAKLGHGRLSMAHAQELREAVLAFRNGGKPAIAWSETFGELGRGTVPYLLATAFDEIWLQPSGNVGLVGTAVSSVFVREALDRAQLEPLFAQRHEYKNAADSLLRNEYSEPHREASERLATSAYQQVISAVVQGRGLSDEQVRALIDRSPISAADAQSERLVDHLGYRDELRQAVDERVVELSGKSAEFSGNSAAVASPPPQRNLVTQGLKRLTKEKEEPELLYLSRYQPRGANLRHLRNIRRPGVGLIHVSGAIRQGRSVKGPFGRAVGSDTVASAIRTAARDERIKAIVLRVNSPGGSYVASDTIWREVCRARDGGTPVVVSMGEVAGSGGYFVAMGANSIVALPSTITGSIGVLAGKVRTAGLLDRTGVHIGSIAVGRHAQMFSPLTGFSDEEWNKLNGWLDEVYADFVAKAARGRGMSAQAIDEVARGRVWTGADALERGLVDELGGLEHALALARQTGRLPPDAPVRPVPSPSPARWLHRPRNSDDPALVRAGVLETVGAGSASEATAAEWTTSTFGPGAFQSFMPRTHPALAAWALQVFARGWGDFTGMALAIGLPAPGPLVMPPWQLVS